MIRKILAIGGCAWSTSEARSSFGNRNFDDDDAVPISSCWTWHFYESATGREREVASLSWSTST